MIQALRRPRSIVFWLQSLVAIVIVPAWVATAVMIALSYEREKVAVQNRAIGTARALLQAVERELASTEAALKVLATSPYLAAGDLAAFQRQASQVVLGRAGSAIVLADAAGQLMISTIRPYGEPLPPSSVPQLVRDVVRTAAPGVSDFYIGPASGKPQVGVGVPVLRDGKVVYVLTMGILSARLGEILQTENFRAGWISSVLDRRGVIVARSERADAFVGGAGSPGLLRRMDAGAEGALTADTVEGIPVLEVFSRSPTLGWTVAIDVPRATVTAQLRRSLWTSVAGAVTLFGLGLVLARLFSLRIARSIRGLGPPALALASGGPVRAPITNVAEVNEVADSLIKTARLLEERAAARDAAERAERDMALAKAAAERSSKAKSQFLAMMSHELRTPLHGILGFAQLIDGRFYGPLTDKQKEFVDAILYSGNHLLDLISDILELSKIEAGRMTVSLERVDLMPVVKSVVATLSLAAEQAEVTLRAGDFGATLPAVRADRVRLAQCLLNLGTNAIKYNRAGGSVTFSYGVVEGRARMSVTDTGHGIAAERQAELFQPFNRLGAERTGIEGTGVGLTLTRRLVELMGGKIGFVSTQGQGSCFWIDLPVYDAVPAAAAPPAARSAEIGPASILYIEDNPSNLLLMRNVLATMPALRLIEATSGEAGLAAAVRHRPDLVIVDINLPDINGMALLRQLQALPGLASTPVLALSATALPSQIRRGLEAGFFAYLTKPLDVNEFLKVVEIALAAAQAARSTSTGAP